MSDTLTQILAALSRLEQGQTTLEEGQASLRGELVQTRTEIMERLDRQQSKLDRMADDIAVNWHGSERVERKMEADREEIRLLGRTVSDLTRMLRMMESRLATLEDKSQPA